MSCNPRCIGLTHERLAPLLQLGVPPGALNPPECVALPGKLLVDTFGTGLVVWICAIVVVMY